MGNVGPEKLVLLSVIALIVLGPAKLPEAARTMGKVLAELRRISGGFQAELRDALYEPMASTREVTREAWSWPTAGGEVQEQGAAGNGASTPLPATTAPPPASASPAPLPDDPTLN